MTFNWRFFQNWQKWPFSEFIFIKRNNSKHLIQIDLTKVTLVHLCRVKSKSKCAWTEELERLKKWNFWEKTVCQKWSKEHWTAWFSFGHNSWTNWWILLKQIALLLFWKELLNEYLLGRLSSLVILSQTPFILNKKSS